MALCEAAAPGPGYRFETVADFARAYRGGQLSPVDVARRLADACSSLDERDPAMQLLIAQDADDLMAQAEASAARFAAGEPLGVFDGVPVAVKDELDQVPYPTTVGTAFLGRESADEDATVAARFRAQGALLFGKTAMHEIGIGVTGLNPHHGTPRNPYDPGHFTGGSSSGPAAVVAAGLCPVAIGADGGGSIRTPAALCGISGLKATYGRISEHGAYPLCWSVGHVGPLAATVLDTALAY
jgi:Asp-tRNA(Asn)/Glu-tRNA(Gln) amidotransferase A subunit family amidase